MANGYGLGHRASQRRDRARIAPGSRGCEDARTPRRNFGDRTERALGPDEPRHLHPGGRCSARPGTRTAAWAGFGCGIYDDFGRCPSRYHKAESWKSSADRRLPAPRNRWAWNHALHRSSEVSSALLANRTGEDWDDLLSAKPGPGGWEALARTGGSWASAAGKSCPRLDPQLTASRKSWSLRHRRECLHKQRPAACPAACKVPGYEPGDAPGRRRWSRIPASADPDGRSAGPSPPGAAVR